MFIYAGWFSSSAVVLVLAAPLAVGEVETEPTLWATLDLRAGALDVIVDGATTARLHLFARTDATPGAWLPVTELAVDAAGSVHARLPAPPVGLRGLELRAVWLDAGRPRSATAVPQLLEQPLGDVWDLDFAWGGSPTALGEVVSTTQPWSFFASFSSTSGGAPASVELLEAVPAPGPDHGLVAAIAARGASRGTGGGGGTTGDPGVLRVEFPAPSVLTRVRIVDTQGPGNTVRTFDGATVLHQQDLPNLGGAGFADVYVSTAPCTAFELTFTGGGGLAEAQLMPWELIVDFDHSTTGAPLALEAGGQVGQAYAPIGIFGDVYAENAVAGHPDLPLLFDTAAPTGGDVDLATPGPGLGNATALGKVLIIAEGDLDADADGLVDDPDDEAGGGVLRVGFITSTVRFRGATVLDVDDGGASFVRVIHDETGAAIDLPLADLGDNSVQTVTADVPTRQIELHLAGSGALGALRLGPIPYPKR